MKLPLTNIDKFIKNARTYAIYYTNKFWIKEALLFTPSNNKNKLIIHYHLQDNENRFEGIQIMWTNTYVE